jgi:hypothetical protein
MAIATGLSTLKEGLIRKQPERFESGYAWRWQEGARRPDDASSHEVER